jgi:hypothetical protein
MGIVPGRPRREISPDVAILIRGNGGVFADDSA